ncbi:MAG: hypothetical protein VW492_17865, partial [Deltaproteobacteria bacterium]
MYPWSKEGSPIQWMDHRQRRYLQNPRGGRLNILDLARPKQGSDCRKPPKTSSKLLQPISGTSRAVSRTPRIMNMATMK